MPIIDRTAQPRVERTRLDQGVPSNSLDLTPTGARLHSPGLNSTRIGPLKLRALAASYMFRFRLYRFRAANPRTPSRWELMLGPAYAARPSRRADYWCFSGQPPGFGFVERPTGLPCTSTVSHGGHGKGITVAVRPLRGWRSAAPAARSLRSWSASAAALGGNPGVDHGSAGPATRGVPLPLLTLTPARKRARPRAHLVVVEAGRWRAELPTVRAYSRATGNRQRLARGSSA